VFVGERERTGEDFRKGDGQFRSVREPKPKPRERLTVVAKAKGAEASGGEQQAAS
jgi:hypothetical protein